MAFKITYFDTPKGTLKLCYRTVKGVSSKQVELKNTGKVQTATFFVDDAIFDAGKFDYDFTIEGSDTVTVSIVRIVKL